jgi:hypothetical protein
MAMTAAERQAAYRQRRNEDDGDRRLNTWVTSGASLALDRLARHYQMTRRAILERLILAADNEVLRGLELDSPNWASYFTPRSEEPNHE